MRKETEIISVDFFPRDLLLFSLIKSQWSLEIFYLSIARMEAIIFLCMRSNDNKFCGQYREWQHHSGHIHPRRLLFHLKNMSKGHHCRIIQRYLPLYQQPLHLKLKFFQTKPSNRSIELDSKR